MIHSMTDYILESISKDNISFRIRRQLGKRYSSRRFAAHYLPSVALNFIFRDILLSAAGVCSPAHSLLHCPQHIQRRASIVQPSLTPSLRLRLLHHSRASCARAGGLAGGETADSLEAGCCVHPQLKSLIPVRAPPRHIPPRARTPSSLAQPAPRRATVQPHAAVSLRVPAAPRLLSTPPPAAIRPSGRGAGAAPLAPPVAPVADGP